MNLEALEDYCAEGKHTHCKYPEIRGGIEVLPEPDLIDKRIPVAFNYVVHGVQLKDDPKLRRERGYVPQYRSCPYTDLKDDGYDLSQVPEKYDDRASDITQPENKNKHTCAVIKYLKSIQIRVIPVTRKQYNGKQQEKSVNEQCRNDLYDRQYAYLEHDLLDEIVVFKQRIGSV